MALTKISGSILKDPLNLGEVSIGGTLTYQDVTNVDSVGIITARSDISIADKIIHTGDTNTAIRFPAADTFTAETSGNERFRIDSNGRIGLGIANPDAYFSSYNRVVMGRPNDSGGMTIVSAPTYGGYIAFADGTSGSQAYRGLISYYHGQDAMVFGTDGGNERLRITNAGLVGIGTDNPQTTLHIKQGTDNNTDGIRLSRSNSNATYSQYIDTGARFNIGYSNPNTADPDPQITLEQNGNVGIGTINPSQKLEVLGTTSLFGNGAASCQWGDTSYIGHLSYSSDGAIVRAASGKALIFHTNHVNERLRITSGGRINIGDADQTQNVDQLSVTIAAQNAVDNVARFQSNAAASGTSESLVKVYKGAGYGGVISGYITQGSDHGMKFYTANNGALTERLRINKSGHVTMPHNPAFHARPPGHYQLNAGPSDTIIGGTWSTGDPESFAQGSLPSGTSIWDNSTGVFTVPVDGIYSIHWNVFLKSNTERRDAMIYLNGTGSGNIIARTEIQNPAGTSARNKNVSVHTIVHLSATDEIRFGVLSDGTTNRLYQNSKPWSYACAALIG